MQERSRKKINQARRRRKQRVRRKVIGTVGRPRLSVYRSLKGIYAQLIDDHQGRTLASASYLSPEIKSKMSGKETKVEIGKQVGFLLAKKANQMGVNKAVFDRSGYLYHGRIKALADGAREGGLEF